MSYQEGSGLHRICVECGDYVEWELRAGSLIAVSETLEAAKLDERGTAFAQEVLKVELDPHTYILQASGKSVPSSLMVYTYAYGILRIERILYNSLPLS